ncbi:hypothetical protein HC028_21090 [Planosporangium flavigriseum]|uniref:Uncharacterized protein n=1 Tax=Planosporangium flavigriseum TaxID=373681 RepID=A0A8J3PM60_9ACTN|nr:hypothetical protein [Planosporangium flavigriseum]NJC66980.1 hypothetical protein [Planosporangium flavigriseum]GIG73954.1 hypothetical protein Pfl04_23580 [Planosporangium flavigriseum]
MNWSIGIWAQAQLPRGVMYRWEADGGEGGTGFVLLETLKPTVWPCDGNGDAIGDLVLHADSGNATGDAAGIDRGAFTRVTAATLKAFLKTRQVPQTAHVYFG